MLRSQLFLGFHPIQGRSRPFQTLSNDFLYRNVSSSNARSWLGSRLDEELDGGLRNSEISSFQIASEQIEAISEKSAGVALRMCMVSHEQKMPRRLLLKKVLIMRGHCRAGWLGAYGTFGVRHPA